MTPRATAGALRCKDLLSRKVPSEERLALRVALLAANDFCGFPYGGTAALVRDYLAARRDDDGCEITLVGLERWDTSNRDCRTRQIGRRVYPFVSVGTVRTPPGPSIRKTMTIGILKHASSIRSLRADVLYAHSPEIALALTLVCPRTPVVLHCHGVDNPMGLSRYRIARGSLFRRAYEELIFYPALRRSSAVLVNADGNDYSAFVARHSALGSSKFQRVIPTIDRSMFSPRDKQKARASWGLPPDVVFGIFTGRIEPPKGIDLVIEAAVKVRRQHTNFELLIVGDGSARAALEVLAKAAGGEGWIRFLGLKSREEIASLLGASDVFISGSHREAVSMALLEAVGCGLPAVVTDCGGMRELIEESVNGAIVRGRNPHEMAQAILTVLRNRDEMGRCSLGVASKFDERTIADRVGAALSSAASR